MTNFDYPNAAAIDKIGVLTDYDRKHGHPEGWTRSVINKIQADIQKSDDKNGPRMGGEYKAENYTPEEQAAYKFYREEVIEYEAWKKLVQEYWNENSDGVTFDKFDDSKQYIDKPGSGFTPPTVTEYSGGNNKNHELSVSVEALEYFVRQIEQIIGKDGRSGMLLDAKKLLTSFEMRPGGFAKAEVLRRKIVGANADDPGLRGDSMALLQVVHEALYQIKENLRTLIKEYDSAEEFNKLTTQQLDEVMGGAWGKISGLKDYGQSGGTTGGG